MFTANLISIFWLELLAELFPDARVYAGPRRVVLSLPNMTGIAENNAQASRIFRDLENLLDEAENIQAAADREDRELTQAEIAEIDRIADNFASASMRLDSHRSTGRKTEGGDPNDPHGAGGSRYGLTNRRTASTPAAQTARSLMVGRRTRDLFSARASERGGWKSGAEFLTAIVSGAGDQRLVMAAAGSEGIGVDGGFAVPGFMAAEIFDLSLESELVRPRAKIYPLTGPTIMIPALDGANHSTDLAGLNSMWMAESGTADRQKLKFRGIGMKANRLSIYAASSIELLSDAPLFERTLSESLASAAAFDLDHSFLNGTGAGMPLGILNSVSKVTVNKESGQVADSLVYSNLLKMFGRLYPGCTANAVWICSPSVLPALLNMTMDTPNGVYPVFLPSAGGSPTIAAAPAGTLLGRPLLISEKLPPLGDQGDIVLVDLSQYGIALRLDMALEKSNAPGWTEYEMDWRLTVRADGAELWKEPVTPRGGGETLSWCVVLATRA